ncbi:MMPL family transporter [Modestobacter sp. VKM Ac-2984]|uniref:MMPL family transporter n=1 Tax=Modestobacter sp. VKM Ac-2984 TaxID=3004138 RepID=UPI0022AA0AC6|nr:MMPL family transporter [Modestobacter sp. VKM Ac-2984]MCZ2816320.1 MMPL family transporter [Modestobacter sp. VKM Ac-2984]
MLALWLVALVGLGGAVGGIGSTFTDSTDLPDSESSTAYDLLAQAGVDPGEGATSTGDLVWQTDGVPVTDPTVVARVSDVLAQIAALPGVESVVSPYDAAGAAQVSAGGDVAYASLALTEDADTAQITALADSLDSATLLAVTGGSAFDPGFSTGGGVTEVIGVLCALVILLLVFRSLWAAVLPIITGVAGVGVAALVILLGSNVIDLPSYSMAMGSLVGLGVGIDYALFIVNRHRKALLSGLPLRDSIAQAVNTSGRAVVFAGATVVVALLGMTVLDIGILTGMALGAAVTVLLTVVSALTLLPALLAVLGNRVLGRSQRRALAAGGPVTEPGGGLWSRWATAVQRRPGVLGIVAAALVVLLAAPALSMRLGSADASSDPADSVTQQYHQVMTEGFGPGFDAQLLLVGQTPDDASRAAFTALAGELSAVDDVAAVSTAPPAAGQEIGVITVTPASTAQAEETADLVTALRGNVVPAAEGGTDLQVYVGGSTASGIDFAQALTSKLPVYLAIIAVLGFVLLALAFRSVLVPLIGAVTNLLSIAAGLGIVTAVFQFGWGSALFGVGSAAPVEPFVSVMVVGIVFGLSMDYQVFLVSRMHEEWAHTRDNRRAVRVGMAETGRVIATAAAIMACVFASFGFTGERIIAELGVGMGAAVLVDAFLVRLVLVPAVMHRIGARTWWYPRWAERITPRVSVEGEPAAPTEDTPAEDPAVPELETTGRR